MGSGSAAVEHHGTHTTVREFCEVRLTRVAYPAGCLLPRHHHELSAFSIVVSGAYTETFGTRRLLCDTRSVLFRPPQVPHRDDFHVATTCLIVEPSSRLLQMIAEAVKLPQNAINRQTASISSLGAQLQAESQAEDDCAALIVQGLVFELAGMILRADEAPMRGRPPQWLLTARKLLADEFASPVVFEEVARQLGIHPVHFARSFGRWFGETPGGYVRRLRFERACHLLASNASSIAEIAVLSGFADHAHLCRMFRRQLGMSPSAYRLRCSRVQGIQAAQHVQDSRCTED